MEGPSIFLAVEQLAPLIGKTVLKVDGNTKIGKERLSGKKIQDIFSWGKHLIFQFDVFALRIHFLLWGSFQATIRNKKVTGDYQKKNRVPRLSLTFKNGHVEMYSCSLRYIENPNAREDYDFSRDVMSPSWDSKKALNRVLEYPESEIADVLLDQTIFAGVGNIIKNEVLYLTKCSPDSLIKNISLYKLKKLIKTLREYVFQFYEWRKQFVLRKHYQIYRQSHCPGCGLKVIRKKTGKRERLSFICSRCQK